MQLLEMFYKERLRALGWSLVLSLLVGGCSESAESPSPQPVAVSVVELKTSEVRPSREFVARTSASARADITARIEAEIREVLFREGARVEQGGQVLLRLEDTRANADLQQAEAELAAARAELDSARRNLDRGGEDVAGKGFLSAADLDKLKDRFSAAQSRLQTAEAALQKARTNLDYAELKAPFNGWVGRLNYDVGAVVGPATGPITSVLVTDPMYVEFQVNEADFIAFRRAGAESAQAVAKSLDLSLTLSDGEVYAQPGTLDFVDVQTDASTGTVAIRAVFPNPDAVLVPGLYVTLKVSGHTGEARSWYCRWRFRRPLKASLSCWWMTRIRWPSDSLRPAPVTEHYWSWNPAWRPGGTGSLLKGCRRFVPASR